MRSCELSTKFWMPGSISARRLVFGLDHERAVPERVRHLAVRSAARRLIGAVEAEPHRELECEVAPAAREPACLRVPGHVGESTPEACGPIASDLRRSAPFDLRRWRERFHDQARRRARARLRQVGARAPVARPRFVRDERRRAAARRVDPRAPREGPDARGGLPRPRGEADDGRRRRRPPAARGVIRAARSRAEAHRAQRQAMRSRACSSSRRRRRAATR